MNNDIEKSIATEGAKHLFQICSTLFKKIGKRIDDELKIQNATVNYAENYLRRHGFVKVLGMTEPVSLKEIYTEVNIVFPSYRNKETAIEELEHRFRQKRGDFGISEKRIDGIKIANHKQMLNVLGPPGSGKSTFLRRIGIEALKINTKSLLPANKQNYIHNCIPVFVELRRFRTDEINILTVLQHEFEIAGFPESDRFLETALEEGALLILLDGLDEVPHDQLDRVIEQIRDFTNKFPSNRFITSCRTAFYKTYLNNFSDVEIAAFDEIQIKQFIRNWFKTDESKISSSTNFINLLFAETNKPTLELAQTPLLLTFLCLTFDESQKLPANKSNLYRRALLILMERWAAENKIHNIEIFQGFTSELEIELLSDVAAKFYDNDKIFFYSTEILKAIKEFFENIVIEKSFSPSKILSAIEIQQGLLVQRAPDIYSFSHLTIQEYLTASYHNSPLKIRELLKNNLFIDRWREVFVLLAGIGNSDDMITIMLEYLIQHQSKDEFLTDFFTWIDNKNSGSYNHLSQINSRAFSVELYLRYIEINNLYPKGETSLWSYPRKIIHSLNPLVSEKIGLSKTILNKSNISTVLSLSSNWNNVASYELEQRFKKTRTPFEIKLLRTDFRYSKLFIEYLIEHINIPEELRSPNPQSIKNLLQYLDGSLLILDCHKAALRLSKNLWEKSIDTLLTTKRLERLK